MSSQKFKLNSGKESEKAESFVVKKDSETKLTINLTFTKEELPCVSPCKLSKTKNFLMLTTLNSDVLYNRKGKMISQTDNSKFKVELTDSFAKISSNKSIIVYSGYNGDKIIEEESKAGSVVKMSAKFLTLSNKSLKIWNSYGQVIEAVVVENEKINLHLSDNFVGYTLGFKKLVLYGANNSKLANYNYDQKIPMNIRLNNSFAYYSIGKKIGVLHAKSGQKLMNFAGRPTQAIYMNERIGGFYDISESASFWSSNGSHLVSLIKEPGLEVMQINDIIEYKTKKNNRFKKIN